jgi:hypothetical protein
MQIVNLYGAKLFLKSKFSPRALYVFATSPVNLGGVKPVMPEPAPREGGLSTIVSWLPAGELSIDEEAPC